MFKVDWEKTSITYQLPEGMVEKMVRLAYPDKKLISSELIAGGCANLNYKIQLEDKTHPLILRIYLRDKDAAYREQKIAALIKETVPAPLTYFIGEVEEYNFAITEFMPGVPLRDLLLDNAQHDLNAVMYEVGMILAKITEYEFSKSGLFDNELNIKEGFDEESINQFSLSCLKHPQVIRYLNPEIRAALQKHLEQLPDFIINSATLVHADFDPANVLVEQKNGSWKVSAVLDWEFAYAGHLMDDVATMLRYAHKMPPEFQNAFLKGLTDHGIILPANFQIIVHQSNIGALLDGITRHPLHMRPNIYRDILELITHILSELNNMQKIDRIEIKPYDPNWPHIFEKEARLIRQALGDNCIGIHHVGSTAVPGLAAKPKIDMIAVVHSGDLSIAQLENIGFSYKGEWNIPFKFGFTKRGQDEINLYVFEEGHPEIELNILFRDHLRSNPQSLKEYAQIKETLIEYEASFQKQKGSMFSGYNLGKDRFIRQILKTSGYNGHRFLKVTHIQEWEDYHRIRKTEIFDPIGVVYDPHHPSITANGAYHFILCHGIEVRTVAHIEFLSESDAALRSLATDAKFQRQGYGAEMMFLLEKWLKRQNIKVLKMHSRLSAEPFYSKLGFAEMPFDDPSIQEQYIDLGKAL